MQTYYYHNLSPQAGNESQAHVEIVGLWRSVCFMETQIWLHAHTEKGVEATVSPGAVPGKDGG